MDKVLYQQLLSGGLMVAVAMAGVLWWKRRSHIQWRWFWAGAGLWTVGVALKFTVAVPLNPIFIGKSGHASPFGFFAGIIYCGLMTGIFEVGITLAAALKWRGLAADPSRALAVGLGAGAFEALVLGLLAAVGALVAIALGYGDRLSQELRQLSASTPLFWLAGPAERSIAIAAHAAARLLVLRSVAGRTCAGFWAGFTWLSLIDLFAGVALLSGMTTSGSIWWVELMILPFGILSIPLARYGLKRWPREESECVEQQLHALS